MYSVSRQAKGSGRDDVPGAAVTVTDVGRRFGSAPAAISALTDVSFEIGSGQMVALVGPSGSGKSTLLNLLGALDRPDAGTIRVDDLDLSSATRRELVEYRRRTGFVFQRYNLLPALTALDNVLAPLLPRRVRFDKVERARGLLAEVGLEGRDEAMPGELSGGEQQRVAIARALVVTPRLLLADEPTGNLDSVTGDGVLALVQKLRTDRGVTVLVATHDLAVAARADRVLHLHDGAVTDDVAVAPGSPPGELLARINELGG
jgi:putative ABC transport system ATP-binding protein